MILSPLLESALNSATANSITEVFLWLMLVIFVLALFWKKKGKHSTLVQYTPTLLTSLGILGTFAGIIIGLLSFDPDNIDGSIALLLNGLKTAFITSLAGMFLSILFKGLVSSGFIDHTPAENELPEEVSAKDIFLVMQQQAEAIGALKKTIGGDDDSSLISQLKSLRTDLSDNSKQTQKHLLLVGEALSEISSTSKASAENFASFENKLWIKFQDFADMLSKSATEQVIEALKQVIVDFNNNLIEQFGENFKALNQACHELVTWQDNYKNQLIDMSLQYKEGVTAITHTQASVAAISEDAKSIPQSMSNLREVMEVNQHQISELDRHLVAFADVRDRAVEAVPEIKAQIQLAVDGVAHASEQLAKGINDSAEQYRDTVDQTRAALTESAQATANSTEEIREHMNAAISDIDSHMRNLLNELQQGGKELNESFKQASSELITQSSSVTESFAKDINIMKENLSRSIEAAAQEHSRNAEKIFASLEKTIEQTLSSTGESVTKQVDMIDKALGEEISKVMQSMGSALASISGQFTSDYSQLVSRMNDVVRKQIQ
jgi:DNA anti-recombination protein RmuC